MVLIRCDSCDRIIESPSGSNNPFEPQELGEEEGHFFARGGTWWSRRDKETGIWHHACSRTCRDKLPGIPAPL